MGPARGLAGVGVTADSNNNQLVLRACYVLVIVPRAFFNHRNLLKSLTAADVPILQIKKLMHKEVT